MAKDKTPGGGWLAALGAQKLEVKSASDGIQARGYLDTGNYALNWAISGALQGGYPLGHTVEIFGDPATGKSFLCDRAIAMIQQAGGVALLDDVERARNLPHMAELGIDTSALAYYHSRTVADHLKVAKAFVGAYRSLTGNGPGLLVCDSLSQLSTTHELEVGLDKRDMTRASELKAFFRIMGSELADIPSVHISTSHVIAAVGNLFNPRTTPGGGGPKYQASVRIDLRGISKIKSGAEHVGVICTAFIDKNRIIAPWRSVKLAIPFGQPISRASGLVRLLLELGVLGEQGQFLTYQGQRLALRTHKSKDSFLKQDESGEALLDQIPELLDEVDSLLSAGTLKAQYSADEAEVDPEEVTA